MFRLNFAFFFLHYKSDLIRTMVQRCYLLTLTMKNVAELKLKLEFYTKCNWGDMLKKIFFYCVEIMETKWIHAISNLDRLTKGIKSVLLNCLADLTSTMNDHATDIKLWTLIELFFFLSLLWVCDTIVVDNVRNIKWKWFFIFNLINHFVGGCHAHLMRDAH